MILQTMKKHYHVHLLKIDVMQNTVLKWQLQQILKPISANDDQHFLV